MMGVYVLGHGPLRIDKVVDAFKAGVAYHDALMAESVQAPEARGTIIEGHGRLEELFEQWHNALAAALEVEP